MKKIYFLRLYISNFLVSKKLNTSLLAWLLFAGMYAQGITNEHSYELLQGKWMLKQLDIIDTLGHLTQEELKRLQFHLLRALPLQATTLTFADTRFSFTRKIYVENGSWELNGNSLILSVPASSSEQKYALNFAVYELNQNTLRVKGPGREYHVRDQDVQFIFSRQQ